MQFAKTVGRTGRSDRSPGSLKGRDWSGFTLLELLVVLAIMAVLASLLAAALNHAKGRAQQISCSNHLRLLQLGWRMYVEDNDDFLPLNRSFARPNAKLVGRWNTTNSWVAGNPKEDTSTDNIRAGTLFPYVQTAAVYRCPSDQSTVIGKPMLRTRSYSMSAFLNGDDADSRVKRKFSEITAPPPASVFVFIEEHEMSSWGGSFKVLPSQGFSLASANWSSTPSDRHNQGCNLSFADGHVEHWKWNSPKHSGSASLHTMNRGDMKDLRRLQNGVPLP